MISHLHRRRMGLTTFGQVACRVGISGCSMCMGNGGFRVLKNILKL